MIRTSANFPQHQPRLNDLEGGGGMKNFYFDFNNRNLGRENLPSASVMSLLRNGNKIHRAEERISVRQRRPYLYKLPKYSENISQHQQESSESSLEVSYECLSQDAK